MSRHRPAFEPSHIVKIQRVALADGWRFLGFRADGTQVVIRKKATRPYSLAAIRKWGDPPNRYITLHSVVPKAAKHEIIESVISITEGGEVHAEG